MPSNNSHHVIDEADGVDPPEVEMTVAASSDAPGIEAKVAEATAISRNAVYRFFYPKAQNDASYNLGTSSGRARSASRHQPPNPRQASPSPPTTTTTTTTAAGEIKHTFRKKRQLLSPKKSGSTAADPDVAFVHNFWTTFDDILILSIFTQLGIVARLASSTWFTIFDGVFFKDSALFVNLPLNCLSCFFMGTLCSGERLMEIIATRFSPPRTQQDIVRDYDTNTELRYDDVDDDDDDNVDDHNNDDNDTVGVVRQECLSPGGASIGGSESSLGANGFGSNSSLGMNGFGLRQRNRGRRRKKRDPPQPRFVSWQPPVHLNEELRDVQLLALERRIRMSKCLILFPVKKEDVDVMEHYFQEGYKKNDVEHGEDPATRHERKRSEDFDDLALREGFSGHSDDDAPTVDPLSPVAAVGSNAEQSSPQGTNDSASASGQPPSIDPLAGSLNTSDSSLPQQEQAPAALVVETNGHSAASIETGLSDYEESADGNDMLPEFTSVQQNVQNNIDRLQRVNLADGWDAGTTPEAMSDDLMLGLRDGFCGALSSFSSWNSAMIALLRGGHVGEAFVGYMLGLQLPIIAYRFGQHIAVYIFIWRTRRETRVDERRGGYGIRVSIDEDSDRSSPEDNGDSDDETKDEDEQPSVRAIVTAVFIMAIVTQCTSISFFRNSDDQQIAMSLLFSPLGVLARWRLSKLNTRYPGFPIGTFTANLLACALSGSLGELLAGNPGPKERIVLVSFIAGFGGTLSSLATFVVEILAGVDPILFRFDGMIYAVASIGCALVVGFVFSASVEWADETAVADTDVGE